MSRRPSPNTRPAPTASNPRGHHSAGSKRCRVNTEETCTQNFRGKRGEKAKDVTSKQKKYAHATSENKEERKGKNAAIMQKKRAHVTSQEREETKAKYVAQKQYKLAHTTSEESEFDEYGVATIIVEKLESVKKAQKYTTRTMYGRW